MGFPISKSNSLQFDIDGVKWALACVQDDDMGLWEVGIFSLQPTGTWRAIFPLIKDGLTNDDVMAFGSVADYILHVLPLAEAQLRAAVQSAKPDFENKPACVGYDFSKDVAFNPDTLSFVLNKLPPLSHAK